MKSFLQAQINEMTKEIDKKINGLDENMLTQSSIYAVKNEYKAIGINIDKLQNNYIFKSGAIMLGSSTYKFTSNYSCWLY